MNPLPPAVFKFPAGIDNRSREYALVEGAARTLDNLDVTRDGGLLARRGWRLILSGACHSLFAHAGFLWLVKDGWLSRMDTAHLLTPQCEVAAGVSYAVLNDEVYWTDGQRVGRITAQGSLSWWGLATPPAPVCAAVLNGGLSAGQYGVAMTAQHPSGLESGAGACVMVDVPEGGGVQVTAPSASGVQFVIYRTPPQGASDELRAVARLAPGSTLTLDTSFPLGRRLESLFAVAPFPGQALVAYKGRLWIAAGNTVWFTSAQSPHWLFPDHSAFAFENPVVFLGAAEDGLYVGTQARVYFLQGADPDKMTQRPVAQVGAAQGTGIELPYDVFLGQGGFPTQQCAWWTTQGQLAVGKPGGIVVYPHDSRFSAVAARTGALTYREHEGMRQILAVLGGDAPPLAASDVPVAEELTHGIVLGDPG